MQEWKIIFDEVIAKVKSGYVTTEEDTLYYEIRGNGHPIIESAHAPEGQSLLP